MLLAFLLGGDALLAVPTPVPSGENQTAGVSAAMPQALCNETLTIRSTPLKDAVPNDHIRFRKVDRVGDVTQ